MKEAIRLIKEKIRETKKVIIQAQDEKIKCLENSSKPNIVLDSVGHTNTNDQENQAILVHCNYIIDMAKVKVNTLEEVLDILRNTG